MFQLGDMGSKLVTIRTHLDPTMAELDRARLAGSGIEAVLPEQFTAQNSWQLINAVGGVRLQVHEEDVPIARQLLGESPMDEGSMGLNAKEQLADRMANTVMVGLLFPPLQYYALWLLLRLWGMEGPMRPMLRRKYLIAASLNGAYIVAILALVIACLIYMP